MKNCTDLSERHEHLPGKVDFRRPVASVPDLACKPLPEMEAGLAMELDRLKALGDRDPLAGLDEVIGFIQAYGIEYVKASAPPLLENAQLRGADFAQTGTLKEMGREESRALIGLHRTQEELVKLGAARVKVRDELDRRQHVRGDTE